MLDTHMPEMDNQGVVRAIRADPTIADVKLILLTSTDSIVLQSAADEKVDGVLTKPVKQAQLFETLRTAVGIGPIATPGNACEPAAATMHSLRILLAEDNEANQEVALYQLRMLGHYADLAVDGIEALKLLEKHEYNAVLMDINMPNLNGYAAAAEVRRREGDRKHTWIIALTDEVLAQDREKCLGTGMDDYMTKPVRARDLVRALEQCQSRTELLTRNQSHTSH